MFLRKKSHTQTQRQCLLQHLVYLFHSISPSHHRITSSSSALQLWWQPFARLHCKPDYWIHGELNLSISMKTGTQSSGQESLNSALLPIRQHKKTAVPWINSERFSFQPYTKVTEKYLTKHNSSARHEIQRKPYGWRPIKHAECGAYLQESLKSTLWQ